MKPKPKPKKPPKKPPPPPEKIVYLPPAEALLSARQVARLLAISPRSLTGMLSRGEYPKPDARLGPQQPRWRAASHDAWVRKRCGLES